LPFSLCKGAFLAVRPAFELLLPIESIFNALKLANMYEQQGPTIVGVAGPEMAIVMLRDALLEL
jgi:hypothetical protein